MRMKTGMKRFMAALGIGAMAVMMLAGCGNGVNDGKDSTAADSKDKTTMTVEEVAKTYRPKPLGVDRHGYVVLECNKENRKKGADWYKKCIISNNGKYRNGDTAKINFPEKVTVGDKEYKIIGSRTLNWTVTGLHTADEIKDVKEVTTFGQDHYDCPARYQSSTVALAKLYVKEHSPNGIAESLWPSDTYEEFANKLELYVIYKIQKADGTVSYENLEIDNVKLTDGKIDITDDSVDQDDNIVNCPTLAEVEEHTPTSMCIEVPVN